MRITEELFQSLGGTSSILGDYLERTVEGFSPDKQATVRRLLGALVSSSRVKQRLSLDALARAADVEIHTAGEIMDELTRQRLTQRFETSQGGALFYELTHDYLATRIALWLGDEFWMDQKAREILRSSLPEWEQRARLLAPDDLQLITAQRDRVHYSEEELALVYASAVAYEVMPVSWEESLTADARRRVLIGLLSHPQTDARCGAARQLADFPDTEIGVLLADAAVGDLEPLVREEAACAIAVSRNCQAIARIMEAYEDPQKHALAEQALVLIRDLEPDCAASIPSSLQRAIQRLVWKRRWQRSRAELLVTTLRGAQGGLVGLGLGMGLFLGLGDVVAAGFEIDQIAAQWRLVISLISVGIPLAGAIGAAVGASSAFVISLLADLSDRAHPWRNWAYGTLTGAVVMALGFTILANIFAGEARLMQSFGAGFLIGAVLVGAGAAPARFSPSLMVVLAALVGCMAFLLAWALGWLISPVVWWLVVMGVVAGIGFYLGLRPHRVVSGQEVT